MIELVSKVKKTTFVEISLGFLKLTGSKKEDRGRAL